MKKILFINNALSGTGGARVILNLAKALADRGNQISILLDRSDNIQYSIDPRIFLYVRGHLRINSIEFGNQSTNNAIGHGNSIHSDLARRAIVNIKKIKNYLAFIKLPFEIYAYKKFINEHKFDLIVNNNVYLNVDRIYFENKITKNYYVNFHNSPNEIFNRKEYSSVLPLKKIYSMVKLLSVSNGIADELVKFNGFENHKVQTIYNPFDFADLECKSKLGDVDSLPENYIVTVSTLTERKRVERAIKAMPLIISSHDNMKLLILGEGHLFHKLSSLVQKLKIEDHVVFLGFQKNPYFYIKNADLLMLTSDSEGLPTVIIESLILGTPVVSTDCPTGPNEILREWGDACLVPISEEYSEDSIIKELAYKAIRILNQKNSIQEVKNKAGLERFDSKVIAQEWELLG